MDGRDWFDKVKGAVAAVVDNTTGLNLRGSFNYSDAKDYNTGQDIGDKGSLIGGLITSNAGIGASGTGAVLAVPTFGGSALAVPIGGAITVYGGAISARAGINLINQKGRVNIEGPKEKGTYSHEDSQKPLPRKEHGEPDPDPEASGAHTELGRQEGRNGDYNQAREFDQNGKPVKDIDFTDHGRSNHPNPHQHDYVPNSTGGTPQRSKVPKELD